MVTVVSSLTLKAYGSTELEWSDKQYRQKFLVTSESCFLNEFARRQSLILLQNIYNKF